MAEIKITKDESVDKTPFVACTTCKGEPKHLILASIELYGEEITDTHFSFEWSDTFQIIQCCGCQTVSFRKLHENSEDVGPVGPDDWGHTVTEDLYPNRTQGRKPIDDSMLLPTKLQRIYQETTQALNSSQPVLTGIGIRAIIETVCKDKKAAGNDLSAKLNDLVAKGVLTTEGADILHKLRVLGNRAAHEVKPHNNVQLDLALDVIDHLLTGTYVLPHHVGKKFK